MASTPHSSIADAPDSNATTMILARATSDLYVAVQEMQNVELLLLGAVSRLIQDAEEQAKPRSIGNSADSQLDSFCIPQQQLGAASRKISPNAPSSPTPVLHQDAQPSAVRVLEKQVQLAREDAEELRAKLAATTAALADERAARRACDEQLEKMHALATATVSGFRRETSLFRSPSAGFTPIAAGETPPTQFRQALPPLMGAATSTPASVRAGRLASEQSAIHPLPSPGEFLRDLPLSTAFPVVEGGGGPPNAGGGGGPPLPSGNNSCGGRERTPARQTICADASAASSGTFNNYSALSTSALLQEASLVLRQHRERDRQTFH